MTELERMIHEAVDKAFKDYIENQAKHKVFEVSPETLERQAKYQELWDKAIMSALESMNKKTEGK